MNILPKKSWHVRNKNNIEKVRRDEENAALEQKEKERRIALAESEARSEVLRQMARKRKHSPDLEEEKESNVPREADKHLNLFKELESGEKVPRKNKEHEEEVRKEKEKQEKAIGLLTYLGQGSSELEDKKPWYSEVPAKRQNSKDELDLKKKKSEDPLLAMNKYLEATEKYEANKNGKVLEKKNNGMQSSTPKPKPGPKTIEQLRKERLEREKAEKVRQQQLLDKINNVDTRDQEPAFDERKMRYNSQFNPDIARTRY